MQLTAYEIALIAGGFGIVGAMMGALLSYRFAIKIANINADNATKQAETNAIRDARAKFRAAFAPALAEIYLARHHGTDDTPIIGNALKKALLTHASAVEEFRPFVYDSAAYQEAWEQYRQTARQRNADIDAAEWGTNAEIWSTVEAQINTILSFAKTIKVEQPVARLPPHKSRRAEFPHRAFQHRSLRINASQQYSERMTYAWLY